MIRVGSALVIGLLLGGLAARWLLAPAPPPGEVAPKSSAATSDARIEGLLAELEAERSERALLEVELQALRALYGMDGEEEVWGDAWAGDDPGSELGEPGAEAADGRGGAPRVPEFDPKSEEPWFRRDVLLALGLSESEIEQIRRRWEQLTMDQLYARDEAARAGRPGRRRLRGELALLKDAAREELGDEGYDAMLFASGQRNRVLLQNVLETSPGWEAGLRPGDQLISYDGERVFTPNQLKTMTRQGHPDQLIEVRVLRDGELERVFVPSGPMGARLSFAQAPPYQP